MSYENYKCDIDKLIEQLAIVFAKSCEEIPENCDMKIMKSILLDKIEDNKYFVYDVFGVVLLILLEQV